MRSLREDASDHRLDPDGRNEYGSRTGSRTPGKRALTDRLAAPQVAEAGFAGSPGPLPHLGAIQRSFGRHDVSGVAAHLDDDSAAAADQLGAHAYTAGHRIAFGQAPDLRLAAHEAAHVVQQRGGVQLSGGLGQVGDEHEQHADAVADLVVAGASAEAVLDGKAHGAGVGGPAIQRQERGGGRAAPAAPVVPQRVVVIGSPAPAEIANHHPLQFVLAAAAIGTDAHTIWMVERTGYVAGHVDLGDIQDHAGAARIVWITPGHGVVAALGDLPAQSVASIHVFSHGVPGAVHLRHGWAAARHLPDYGLDLEQAAALPANMMTAGGRIRFDSCNTGTADIHDRAGNLAEQVADQTGAPVEAWTGRTSYVETNASGGASGRVGGSQILRGTHVDVMEGLSQAGGRSPEVTTFEPVDGPVVRGFRSYFAIERRLPHTRYFEVPAHGGVAVRCPDPHVVDEDGRDVSDPPDSIHTEDGAGRESDEDYARRVRRTTGDFTVYLYRDSFGVDDNGMPWTFEVGPNTTRATWSNLEAGTYYLMIDRPSGEPHTELRSHIDVEVHGPRRR